MIQIPKNDFSEIQNCIPEHTKHKGLPRDRTREALSILCSSERSTCYKHTLQLQLQEAEQEC